MTATVLPAASAKGDDWVAVTSEKKLSCTQSEPCWIRQAKDKREFYIHFNTSADRTGQRQAIRQIVISDGKKRVLQTLSVDGAATRWPSDPFRFFEVKLQSNDITDFALYAYNTAADGEYYHYLVYDARTGRFRITKEAQPILRRVQRGKQTVLMTDNDEVINLQNILKEQ